MIRRVSIPLAMPALAAGVVLTWARALGEFGATIMFAGNIEGRTTRPCRCSSTRSSRRASTRRLPQQRSSCWPRPVSSWACACWVFGRCSTPLAQRRARRGRRRLVGPSAGPPACRPARQPVGRPASLSAGPPACRPARQPVGRPASLSAGRSLSAGPPACRPARQPVGRPASLSAGPPARRPAGRSAGRPVGPSTSRSERASYHRETELKGTPEVRSPFQVVVGDSLWLLKTWRRPMTDYDILLRDHVSLTCRSIDRIFLQGYVPQLQSVGPGVPVPRRTRLTGSRARPRSAGSAMPTCRAPSLGRGPGDPGHPLRQGREQGGDRPAAHRRRRGRRVVTAGSCSSALPRRRRRSGAPGRRRGTERAAHPHMEWGRQMAFVNHFYLYLWDPEWGPAFWKTNAYAPYPVWLWLNGHEWAKRQLERRPGSATSPSTTASARATTRPPCSGSATAWGQVPWSASSPAGRPACRHRSRRPTVPPATATARLPPVRGVRHAGLRSPGGGPGLLRGRHPRPPRCRAAGPGRDLLRPADQSPHTGYLPDARSSPRASTPSCPATTARAGSSST